MNENTVEIGSVHDIAPMANEEVVHTQDVENTPSVDNNELFLAEKFAELSRREQQLQRERTEAKQAKERLAELEAQMAAARKDPDTLLKTYNLEFNDLIEYYANLGSEPTEQMKIRELERKLTEFEQREQEKARLAQEQQVKAQQAYEQQVAAQYKQNAEEIVLGDPERYELLANIPDLGDQIFAVAEEIYNSTADVNGLNGKILSPQEVADLLEDYYTEQLEQLTKLNKVKSRFVAPTPEPEPIVEQKVTREPVTLTNMVSITPKVTVESDELGGESYAVRNDVGRKRAEDLLRKQLGWK